MRELPSADVTWREDGYPFSARFGDVYFSGDGIAETNHVFLDGIGAPDVWRGARNFTIAETGFGTGLNFLSAWALWRETAPAGARLDFVSVEGFPLDEDTMVRAHRSLGALRPLADALRAALPTRKPGFHSVSLDGGRVRLLLLYGEAADMLAALEAGVDAWFLDGFAPAKNPEMWSEAVIGQVARLSRAGARLATFTAAGAVRRALEAAGFAMEKRPGLEKRECLAGRFVCAVGDADPAPWFSWPGPLKPGSHVAVVGAGIAGATAARALCDAGFDITVHEAGPAVASGASGTPVAIMQPRPLIGNGADGLFHAAAYRTALELYDRLEAAGKAVWRQRGLLVLGRDAGDVERYGKLDHGETVDGAEAARRAGIEVGLPGTWFGAAGALDASALCRALLDGIEVRCGKAVGAEDAAGGADAVLLAAGHATLELSGFDQLGLNANRGQLTRIAPSAALAGQAAPVTYGGYLVKDGGGHVIGSTYRRVAEVSDGTWQSPDAADDAANLALLAGRMPVFDDAIADAGAAWVGLRATTADRLPVLGPVPDVAAYEAGYARLRHGPAVGPFPNARFRSGLYVLAGLGSRGFLTAPLSAEIVAAGLAGRPRPQPKPVLAALHPARFLINRLRRRRPGA
ncbi:MAG: bifunctional tRNA (5-methylaminomethyl-2-thiouridine)(34)-methyltransferase MnmD/FAD-dependent 5-carboxymethylaminomethyl-2-thiouridine(34) oxidoreductase MnmC [Rhodospirillaceae bacterium]